MGATPYGYPYPEPADRARNGSVAIRSLAEYADAREAALRGDLQPLGLSYYQTGNAGAIVPVAAGATTGVGFDPGGGTADWGMSGAAVQLLSGPFRIVLVTARVEVAAAAPPATERASLVRVIANGGVVVSENRQYLLTTGGAEIADVRTHTLTCIVGMNPGDTVGVDLVNQSPTEGLQINGPRQISVVSVGVAAVPV